MAQFTNQAQLTYNNTVTNSNVAIGELTEVLSINKSALLNEYSDGSSTTYVISIVNSGAADYNALTVTDNLGAYDFNGTQLVPLTYTDGTVQYYVNGVLQPTPAVTGTSPLTVTGINVPSGGNATIIYQADANEYAPLEAGSTITNTATLNGAGVTATSDTETINAETEPRLSVTKSVSPVPVAENGRLTYTFYIQNSGNTPLELADDAVITDTFDPVLSDLAVTFNGNAWAEGTNYTYDQTSGLFTTAANQLTVPAATFTQDATTGAVTTTPGVSTLVVTGTV